MKDRWYIFIIVVLAVLSGSLYASNKGALNNVLSNTSFKPESFFAMSDNLSCTVKRSSDKQKIGVMLSLLGLETDSPKLLSHSNGITFPLTKLYESEDTITVGLIATGSGSTDIFIIDKKTGEFARTVSGTLDGIYAFASKGTCK